MPLLTLENLNPYTFTYYDNSAYTRGRAYYNEGRVSIISFDGQTATCRVRGQQGTYAVTLTAESKQRVKTTCDCPQAARTPVCKHVLASVLAVHQFVEHAAMDRWQYRLAVALESTPRQKNNSAHGGRTAILFGLLREKYYQSTTYRLVPLYMKSQEWHAFNTLKTFSTQAEQNDFLDQERSWASAVTPLSHKVDFHTVANLTLDGVHLCNLMTKLNDAYYGIPEFAQYLALMARLDMPVFLMTGRGSFKERLQLIPDPVKIEAALVKDGEDYSLQAGLSLNGETFNTLKGSFQILSTDPAWALAGHYILPVENPTALNLLNFLPMTIPAKEAQEFRDKYLHSLLERFPVKGDVVAWKDVESGPVPRLYLTEKNNAMVANLHFGYGDYEVEADPKADAVTLLDLPDSWGMVRIRRSKEREDRYYQSLTEARYGLKRSGIVQGPSTFELRARTHPFDFMLHAIPQLVKAGFEIYGEENLKAGRINRSTPTISLNITSGQDWFDVQATIHYGDQSVGMREIRRALLKREGFVKLADGSIGEIPELWLKRYQKLFELGEERNSSLRVRDFHIPLVETLLADADESQVAAEFEQRRLVLRSFDHIRPQDVPAGFVGELRPYQKAGLEWLHFLNEYGFGGCLADDMGLGKTVEVLALLLSLKEQDKAPAPTLLVVPKSLIANWQRESERFTPALRILEFLGNFRKKDSSVFNEYDIILTTYGTMLRDIELLKGFHFNYAILDESQAIKNPVAQVARAARLLDASHRLVMTGTPVENNTFELWSQFAFLNPGLLGSMEYFNREFARPIESRSGDETIQLLRRLIYPFILRRTKEQVAPELPPRTERILFTDFEPAQRKLYNRTHDYYRGLLIGLIDKEGMEDVRMKILEGLLRLRQVCIHPLLVEPAYRGESAKFELLLDTLETLHEEGHKALIFSQFVETLHLLQKELDARHMPYTYLDGQTRDRQEQVDAFQQDPAIPFFLISLKAGGVGLNLTAADYVIHIDPWWNPAVEMQAADRAHRIGQDKPVFIYRIITRDSVEEKILKLQEHKRELVEQLISSEGSFFKSITREDVSALFS